MVYEAIIAKRRSRIGTWELDLTTTTLRASKGFKQLFVKDPAAPFTYAQLNESIDNNDAIRLSRAIADCTATGADLDIALRFQGGTDDIRWIELKGEMQFADESSAARLVGVALDTTQSHIHESAARQTGILLRAVLETAPGLIYAKDRVGRMLIANPPALELIGKPWEQVENRTDAEFLDDADQGVAIMANDRRIMESGQSEVLEERVGTDSEHPLTWLSTKAPLRNDAGHIIGLVGISQNITDRKVAEERLVELNKTLERRVAERTRERDSAWNCAQELLVVLDSAGILRTINPAWTVTLGWTMEEIVNRSYLDFIHPDDHPSSREALVHASGALLDHYENRYRHKDGTYRWIEWSAAPSSDRIYASGRHITAEKQAAAALAERTRQLESSNKELDSFSYSVSHDLRAPLRVIDGFGLMLEEDHADQLDTEGRRLLSTIRANVQRMSLLIEDLLAFSKLSHVPMVADEINVNSMVQSVVEEIQSNRPGTAVTINVEALAPCRGDRGLLHQVWVNLISNAIKYGVRQPHPRIDVQSRATESEIVYSIKDNGVGFDMKYVDKLFGVFQRLHAEKDFSGTGVGLAIVHRIIVRHGGRVWAEGQPGEGAIFSFALPIMQKYQVRNDKDLTRLSDPIGRFDQRAGSGAMGVSSRSSARP